MRNPFEFDVSEYMKRQPRHKPSHRLRKGSRNWKPIVKPISPKKVHPAAATIVPVPIQYSMIQCDADVYDFVFWV